MKREDKYEIIKRRINDRIHKYGISDQIAKWELIKMARDFGITEKSLVVLMKRDADFKIIPIKQIEAVYEMVNDEGGNYGRIVDYLQSKYDFRYNEVTGRVEFKYIGGDRFEPLTDYYLNTFHHELKTRCIPVQHHVLPLIVCSTFSPRFNPFQEYFDSLPVWDGKVDYIDMLAQTVKTDEDDLWRSSFKKWIVAVVGSLLVDNVINHTLIVFSGSQGLGKTRWMERLVPAELKEYYYAGIIDPNNKDTMVYVAESMLINLDELSTMNRTQIEDLKQLITQSLVRVRRPYDKYPDIFPRRASFMGSVNTRTFLNDATGSRRFLAFEVTRIDYQHKIDLRMVFAQAKHLFQNGYQYWFNKEEIEKITDHNEQYQFRPIEEEILLDYFEPYDGTGEPLYMTATEVLTFLQHESDAKLLANTSNVNVGKAMTKHEFERVKKDNRWKYILQKRNSVRPKSITHIDVEALFSSS